MSRLIAFGCSNTYGHGLEDCHMLPGLPGKPASKLAWPNTIGKLLNCSEIINQSILVASNKLIWKTIVDFNFKQDDLVFINWSYFDRHCFFRDDSYLNIGSWIKDKPNKFYYKLLYSEKDSILDFFNRTDHAKRYLDSLTIKNFHTKMSNLKDREIYNLPNWCCVNFLSTSLENIGLLHPLALDGMHPGQGAHDQFANDLYLEIY